MIEKDLSYFGKYKAGKLGLRAMCKFCYQVANKDWNRIRLYGINHNQYTYMLEQCKSLCEICGNKPLQGHDLCVDHDHITLKIRGLLCKRCNRGLGKLGDSIENLLKAIEYLERPAIRISNHYTEKKKDISRKPEMIYEEGKIIGRVCNICGIGKNFNCFGKFNNGYMGRLSVCKKCNTMRKFAYKMKELYGMTVFQYEKIYSEQKGLCGICKQKSKRELCVDHDHNSDILKIRGLLCHNCNMGIGTLGDTLECLQKAKKYLQIAPRYEEFQIKG